MKSIKSKFIVFALGVITSLILLELFLRITGFVYSYGRAKDKELKGVKDAYTILCLGDSHTAGTGAPMNYDYPHQLKRIFERDEPGRAIKIVNRGIEGYNTAMILKNFNEVLNSTNPDLVIILAGVNNYWNAYGNHLNKNTLFNHLRDSLYNIKTFKLIKLLIYDIKNKTKCSLKPPSPTQEKTLLPPVLARYFAQAIECERVGKYKEAMAWHTKIIEANPNFSNSYESLGRIHLALGDREEAKKYLKKAIEIDPGPVQRYGAFANFVSDTTMDKEDLQFLKKYVKVNPAVRDVMEEVSARRKYIEELRTWIAADINSIIKEAHRKGIKVVLQNYANYNLEMTAFINEILRQIAQKESVPFVDNERAFAELKNKEEYFAFDKVHCNEKGYGIMAENLYKCIKENNLIEQKRIFLVIFDLSEDLSLTK